MSKKSNDMVEVQMFHTQIFLEPMSGMFVAKYGEYDLREKSLEEMRRAIYKLVEKENAAPAKRKVTLPVFVDTEPTHLTGIHSGSRKMTYSPKPTRDSSYSRVYARNETTTELIEKIQTLQTELFALKERLRPYIVETRTSGGWGRIEPEDYETHLAKLEAAWIEANEGRARV